MHKDSELTKLYYCCPIWAAVSKLSLFSLDRFHQSLHGHQRLKPFFLQTKRLKPVTTLSLFPC